jgi:hypothetical protein
MGILNINKKWLFYLTVLVGFLVVADISYKLFVNYTDSEVNFKATLTSEIRDFENGDSIYWKIDKNKIVDNLVVIFMPSENDRYPYEHKENNWYNKLIYSVDVSSGEFGANIVLDKIKSDILLLVNKNTDLFNVEYLNDKHTVGVLFEKISLVSRRDNYSNLRVFHFPIVAIFCVMLILYASNLLYKQIKFKKYTEINLFIISFLCFFWQSISSGVMEILTILISLFITIALFDEISKLERQSEKENL